jgi:hypothetical protein
MMHIARIVAACSMTSALLCACAFDVVRVEQHPATLRASHEAAKAFVLEADVSLVLPVGYRRVLKRGSRWDYVGSIEAGDVYATRDQVLTVEASNIYEAYIVVKGTKLVGFYLPVQRTYSPSANSVSLAARPL